MSLDAADDNIFLSKTFYFLGDRLVLPAAECLFVKIFIRTRRLVNRLYRVSQSLLCTAV